MPTAIASVVGSIFFRSYFAFVEDGYKRVCNAIEADIRPEIERKYADEWNASGLFKRWFLLRRIEQEVSARVVEQSQRISPTSLF